MNNLTRYSYPLARSTDRFFGRDLFTEFDRLFDLAPKRPATSQGFDLYEDDDHYFAQVDLPGVKRDRLSLELEDDRLTISVRPDGENESASAWAKAFTLPEGVVSDDVGAKLEAGVLTLTLPKAESPKPRQIEVK